MQFFSKTFKSQTALSANQKA